MFIFFMNMINVFCFHKYPVELTSSDQVKLLVCLFLRIIRSHKDLQSTLTKHRVLVFTVLGEDWIPYKHRCLASYY